MAKSRDKGARTELELRDYLRRLLGDPSIKRNLEQTREGGFDLTGQSLRHFAIESKSGDPPQFKPWIEQAEAQAGEALVPVVCQWRPGQPWRVLVVMDLPRLADYIRWTNLLRDGRT